MGAFLFACPTRSRPGRRGSAISSGRHDRISIQFHVMDSVSLSPGQHLEGVPAGSFVHVDALPGSRAAASSAASRAHKRGELIPIRKGLYWKGTRTRYGMSRPPSEAAAVEILGKVGVGPTGHTAARALGLTTQLPATPALTIAGPVPSSVPGVRVSRRNNMRRRELSYTEIALLELLRGSWESVVEGGWDALVTATAAAAERGSLRLDRIASAVTGEHSPTVRDNFARLAHDVSDRLPGALPVGKERPQALMALLRAEPDNLDALVKASSPPIALLSLND
jgi:hypothetical protein